MLADHKIVIISDHLCEYWNKVGGGNYELAPMARRGRALCKDRNRLMVDEFGLGSYENQKALMETIRKDGIVGGLIWNLRSHRRDGGWHYHNKGSTPANSFHVPGFAAGFANEETRLLDLSPREASAIRGMNVQRWKGLPPRQC